MVEPSCASAPGSNTEEGLPLDPGQHLEEQDRTSNRTAATDQNSIDCAES